MRGIGRRVLSAYRSSILVTRFRDAQFQQISHDVTAAIANLERIQHGLPDGTNYRDALEGKTTIAEVIVVANQPGQVFRQKGMVTNMKKARDELYKVLKDSKDLTIKIIRSSSLEEMETRAGVATKASNVTAIGVAMLQLLNDTQMASNAKVVALTKQIDFMPSRKVLNEELHPVIWEATQQACRT